MEIVPDKYLSMTSFWILSFRGAVRSLCQRTGDRHLILLITLCDTLRAVLEVDVANISQSDGVAR